MGYLVNTGRSKEDINVRMLVIHDSVSFLCICN